MVSILDRYVIRCFLHSYLVALVTLVALYLAIDISSHLGNFVEQSSFWGLFPLIGGVYVTHLPLLFKELSPGILLVGATFALTELSRRNELVPIKASGTSLFRVLRPVFLMASLLTVLTVIDQEVVIPALAGRISWAEAVSKGKSVQEVADICVRDNFGNIFLPRTYMKDKQQMQGLYLLARYEDGKKKLEIISADAEWRPGDDGVYRWYVSDGKLIKYGPGEERLETRALGRNGYVIDVATAESTDEFHIRTDLLPRDFAHAGRDLYLHSVPELHRRLGRNPDDIFLNVELHKRYAFPLAHLILLTIGVPLMLHTHTRSRFLGAGLAILVFASYYAVMFFCVELGNEGTIAPAAAAWLPVLVFGPLGLFLLDSIRT